MKTLKFKTKLFSLCVFVLTSILIISCEKDFVSEDLTLEELTEIDQINSIEAESKKHNLFILPHGYDNLSDEEVGDYFQTLDNETKNKLSESRKIAHYFKYLNKFDVLYESSNFGEIFNEETLKKYLSQNEVDKYKNFNVPFEVTNKTNACNCTGWQHIDTYTIRICRGALGIGVCTCYEHKIEVRECSGSWTCIFYREYKDTIVDDYDCTP